MSEKIEIQNLLYVLSGREVNLYQRALAKNELDKLQKALSEKDAEIARLKEKLIKQVRENAKLQKTINDYEII